MVKQANSKQDAEDDGRDIPVAKSVLGGALAVSAGGGKGAVHGKEGAVDGSHCVCGGWGL